MYVSWLLWLSTLYSNVISSYVKRHGDATWLPVCSISASSHHLHSHRAQFFPRCGVLVAFSVAEGWKSPWHFAVRPVAETLDNHLWLLLPASRSSHATKLNLSFQPLSIGRLSSLSNIFFYSSDTAIHQCSHVQSSTRRRCGGCRSHWIVGNVVFICDLRSVSRRPSSCCQIITAMGCKWVLEYSAYTKPYVYLIFECYYLNFQWSGCIFYIFRLYGQSENKLKK